MCRKTAQNLCINKLGVNNHIGSTVHSLIFFDMNNQININNTRMRIRSGFSILSKNFNLTLLPQLGHYTKYETRFSRSLSDFLNIEWFGLIDAINNIENT